MKRILLCLLLALRSCAPVAADDTEATPLPSELQEEFAGWSVQEGRMDDGRICWIFTRYKDGWFDRVVIARNSDGSHDTIEVRRVVASRVNSE